MRQEFQEMEGKLKINTSFHEKEHWRKMFIKFMDSLIEGYIMNALNFFILMIIINAGKVMRQNY